MAFLALGSGVFLSVCLFILARHFANRSLAFIGLIVLLLGMGGSLLLSMFQSDADKIRAVVRQLSTAIMTNDSAAVDSHISPDASDCRARAAEEMNRFEFDLCNVSGFEPVEFDPNDPTRASIAFEVWVKAKIRREMSESATGVVELKLWFERGSDENWRVTGYAYRRPSNEPWGNTPPNSSVGSLYY